MAVVARVDPLHAARHTDNRQAGLQKEAGMEFDEPRQPPRAAIVLGEDLSLHSLEELEARIESLKAEIGRIESVLAEKRSSRDAAETVFKR
jgi:uncharacterized small protein (DUF1192 family)